MLLTACLCVCVLLVVDLAGFFLLTAIHMKFSANVHLHVRTYMYNMYMCAYNVCVLYVLLMC